MEKIFSFLIESFVRGIKSWVFLFLIALFVNKLLGSVFQPYFTFISKNIFLIAFSFGALETIPKRLKKLKRNPKVKINKSELPYLAEYTKAGKETEKLIHLILKFNSNYKNYILNELDQNEILYAKSKSYLDDVNKYFENSLYGIKKLIDLDQEEDHTEIKAKSDEILSKIKESNKLIKDFDIRNSKDLEEDVNQRLENLSSIFNKI